MMLIPLMENSSLKSYLYFLPSQVFFFVYGLTGRMAVQLREENAHGKVHEAIRKYKSFIFTVMIVFSMVIALEDLVVIFNVDSYIGNISIFNRSVSEDIMRIIIAIASIRAFSGILGGKFGSEAGAKKGKPVDPVEAFAKEHQFTEREKEIFARILKNKSNQEISEELFLSLGTVKTHTHNIFNKLDVTKRREAAEIFDEFREELEAEVETE
ncbi:MAG: helix-turn-helix transcriptional regulator [Mogibacterium sp.]|nr:helix-turn-helix transcriptional regulator [Mogibacterium sp.]